MRVIYFRKCTWVLLASCSVVFIVGNILLFNRFLGRRKLEHGRQAIEDMGKDMLIKRWKNDPKSPLGQVADILDRQRGQGIEGIIDPKETDGKTTSSPQQQQQHVNSKQIGDKYNDESNEVTNNEAVDPAKPKDSNSENGVTVKDTNRDDESEDTIRDNESKDTNSENGPKDTNRDNEAGEAKEINNVNDVEKGSDKIAVLVISCNRAEYVKRCLNRLLEYRPSENKFPIIVSQDCGHQGTADTIRSYGDKISYIRQPDLGNVAGVSPKMFRFMNYYKISRHFKFALGKAFDDLNYNAVLIVEDDLEIAPDFYEYFAATRPLLDKDPTLWCVSAWNDNGKEGLVQSNDLLYRTDFFPGLGWMLTKNTWNELKPKWPLGFWDDWMRQPEQRKGRACIRPDIPRTKTYGKMGVSLGQFYYQHLKFIKLNDQRFPFLQTDLSYLIKENYDPEFRKKIAKAPLVTMKDLSAGSLAVSVVKLYYSNEKEFERLAKLLRAMTDLKSGVARASYMGVVTVMHGRTRVYLTPQNGIS